MSDIKFDYKVTPKIAIRGVSKDIIKKDTVLALSKEQVKFCLKHGPVYRKYDDGMEERAYTYNLDRLHYEKYISEEDWKNIVEQANKVIDNDDPIHVKEYTSTWDNAPKLEEVNEVKVNTEEAASLNDDNELKDIVKEVESIVSQAESIKDTVESLNDESKEEVTLELGGSFNIEEVVSKEDESLEDTNSDEDDTVEENEEEDSKVVVEENPTTPVSPTTNTYNRKKRKNRR